jgi:transposase
VKVAIVIDRTGMPVRVATDAANVPETVVGPAAVACIPAGVRLRWGLPLVADRAYDSHPLREYSAERGFSLPAPHRRNRVRPPTNDGRRRRRWLVERTFVWRHSYRRVVTRFERDIGRCDGFVHLACAFMARNRLVK